MLPEKENIHVEDIDENGFHPIVLGTPKNFLPDWVSETESDASDIVELYERKVRQSIEGEYRAMLNRNYLEDCLQTGERRIYDLAWGQIKSMGLSTLLEYDPYPSKTCLYLIRNGYACMNSMVLYDLDGFEDHPAKSRQKLEIISLIREAQTNLIRGLMGVPSYVYQSPGTGNQWSRRILLDETGATGVHFCRELNENLWKCDTENWYSHYSSQYPANENRWAQDLAMREFLIAESAIFLSVLTNHQSQLPESSCYRSLLMGLPKGPFDKGRIEDFDAVFSAKDDFEKDFQTVTEEAWLFLNAIDALEPLETCSLAELEYCAYMLGNCKDKALRALEK